MSDKDKIFDSRDDYEFFTGAGRGLNNDSFNTVRGRFVLKGASQAVWSQKKLNAGESKIDKQGNVTEHGIR